MSNYVKNTFVCELTSYCFVENSGRGTEVEWATGRIDVTTFAQVGQIFNFISVEMTGEVQVFTANNSNFATLQKVFGNNGSQTANQVATSINNNGLQKKVSALNNTLFINSNKFHLKIVNYTVSSSYQKHISLLLYIIFIIFLINVGTQTYHIFFYKLNNILQHVHVKSANLHEKYTFGSNFLNYSLFFDNLCISRFFKFVKNALFVVNW